MLVTLRGQRLNKKFSSNVSYVLFSPNLTLNPWHKVNRSDKGLMLETSAFLLFMVANLHFQLSCLH